MLINASEDDPNYKGIAIQENAGSFTIKKKKIHSPSDVGLKVRIVQQINGNINYNTPFTFGTIFYDDAYIDDDSYLTEPKFSIYRFI